MGNHLVATAPSQILNVESCLTALPDHTFDKSLGSTRFMKVARAKCMEGYTVIKVFILPEPAYDIEAHKSEINHIKMKLKQASNCLPFQQSIITDRAAIIIRQYVKHNLYDRLSTRPFYNLIERKWVAFQLLCALNQMAKFNICHGDIKSENVLVTSWNWLLLADFASFKPTKLPDDNPANFSYFFDTARRRTCYIAPERFVDSQSFDANEKEEANDYKIAHASDIFSTGCVIAELFTDGSSLFDLSQLLSYRSGTFYPDACLDKIEDKQIKLLVQHMIQIDPLKRFTAEQYLTFWKGKVFPDHFYTFLKVYLGRFCEPPLMSADQTVSALFAERERIIQTLVYKEDASGSLIVLAPLLLSSVRGLKYCNCKLKALHLIVEFAKHLSADIILERFLPYLMYCIKDNMARVRAYALRCFATCLTFVCHIPYAERNTFSEYIIPGVGVCTQDRAVPVRQAFAENIAVFAEWSLKFLDHPQQLQTPVYMSNSARDELSFDAQQQIRHVTQNRVQQLMTDADSTIRSCLLEYSISRLCAFFGRQKADDVLLSHMITFLNDKQDWQLRVTFFSSLIAVCAYIGWQSSYILKPLLQQGLNDGEDFVVAQTMTTIASLIKLGLLPKQLVIDLLHDNVSFLIHPCEWIRNNTVSFVSAAGHLLDLVDLHCYLVPAITPFLEHHVMQIDKERVVLHALTSHITQPIYSFVCNSKHPQTLYEELKARHNFGDATSDEADSKLSDLRKLLQKGMTKEEEKKVLLLEKHIIKQHQNVLLQNNAENDSSDKLANCSVINLKSLGVMRRHAEMIKDQVKDNNASVPATAPIISKKVHARSKTAHTDHIHDVNTEWKSMFGSESNKNTTPQLTVPKKSKTLSSQPISMSQLESAVTLPNVSYNVPVKEQPSNLQLKYSSCKLDLRVLVHHRRDVFKEDAKQKRVEELANARMTTATCWRPQGILVAHMSEHRGAINKVAVSPSGQYFVTVSSDRSLKLWESLKLEGKSVVNRSKASHTRFGGALKCASFCDDVHVACASDKGYLHYMNVELMSARPSERPDAQLSSDIVSPVINTYPVSITSQGQVTDLLSMVNSRMVVYLTSYGHVVALDIRQDCSRPAWELKHDLHYGLPTSLCIDPKQHWLCVGSARGVHVCWDLRFQLPITRFSHPSMAGIRRVTSHPHSASSVISVVSGNNEVSVWDIETGSRQLALWASSAPALSQSQKSADSVNGVHVSSAADGGMLVFTGGTDGRIRMWDVNNVERSRVVCGPEHQSRNLVYETRLVDGVCVLQEQVTKAGGKSESAATVAGVQSSSTASDDFFAAEAKRTARPGEHCVPVYHRDVITDLAQFTVNQTFLVSTSREGVVKIWK